MTVPQEFLDALHPSGRATIFTATEETAGPRGGLVFFAPPRGKRRSTITRLRAEVMDQGEEFLVLKSGKTDILCPFDADAIRFMHQTWPVSPRWKRVESLLRWVPGSRRVLLEVLPGVAVASHAGGARISNWLAKACGQQRIRPLVVTSWKGPEHGAVTFGFVEGSRLPMLLAKTADRHSDADVEVKSLVRLWRNRVADRPAIPRPLSTPPGSRWRLQTVVPGRPVSRLLSDGAFARDETVTMVADKLLSWNIAERRISPLEGNWLESRLYKPLRELEDALPNFAGYASLLEGLAQPLIGRPLSTVVVHNDCTTANCLWDTSSGLALVDWETCDFEGPPLADIFYSACDIVHNADQTTRLDAFTTCFVGPGEVNSTMSARTREWQTASSDPWNWMACSFHACWLHHARNEKRAGKSGSRPFLSIVQELAEWKDPIPPFICSAMQGT